MVKNVDAGDQIALGEKYAGRLFEVIHHPGDKIELIPAGIAAAAQPPALQIVQVPDGWVPPGSYDGCTQWALDNRDALEHYARQVEEAGTAAGQLQRYLAELPEMPTTGHGEI